MFSALLVFQCFFGVIYYQLKVPFIVCNVHYVCVQLEESKRFSKAESETEVSIFVVDTFLLLK